MEAPVTTTPKTDSPTCPFAEAQNAGADEELNFSIPGDGRIAAINTITSRAMARHGKRSPGRHRHDARRQVCTLEDIAPAPFPALVSVTAFPGRAWTDAVTSCAGAPSFRRADASHPATMKAIAAYLIGNAGPLGRNRPTETQFREHLCLPGCCAGRHGVAADPQRWSQGRPRNSGRVPRLLSPRQLARSVHQPRRFKCGGDDQRAPYIGRPPGHPRGPGPYAAAAVGCGLARVPQRPLPHTDHSPIPVKATFHEVTHV